MTQLNFNNDGSIIVPELIRDDIVQLKEQLNGVKTE